MYQIASCSKFISSNYLNDIYIMGGYVSMLDIQETSEQSKNKQVRFDDNNTIINSKQIESEEIESEEIKVKDIGIQVGNGLIHNSNVIPRINFNKYISEPDSDVSEPDTDVSEPDINSICSLSISDDNVQVENFPILQNLENRISFLETKLEKANHIIKTMTVREIKYIDELDDLYIENQRLQTKYNCLQLMHK